MVFPPDSKAIVCLKHAFGVPNLWNTCHCWVTQENILALTATRSMGWPGDLFWVLLYRDDSGERTMDAGDKQSLQKLLGSIGRDSGAETNRELCRNPGAVRKKRIITGCVNRDRRKQTMAGTSAVFPVGMSWICSRVTIMLWQRFLWMTQLPAQGT